MALKLYGVRDKGPAPFMESVDWKAFHAWKRRLGVPFTVRFKVEVPFMDVKVTELKAVVDRGR